MWTCTNIFQLIHKYIHLTFYLSLSLNDWSTRWYHTCTSVLVNMYIWIYVSTCRHMWNWFTLKHLVLVRRKGLKKSPKIPGNTLSDALLKSLYQIFAADAAKKIPRFARFFWRESPKQMMRTFNIFLPGTLVQLPAAAPSLLKVSVESTCDFNYQSTQVVAFEIDMCLDRRFQAELFDEKFSIIRAPYSALHNFILFHLFVHFSCYGRRLGNGFMYWFSQSSSHTVIGRVSPLHQSSFVCKKKRVCGDRKRESDCVYTLQVRRESLVEPARWLACAIVHDPFSLSSICHTHWNCTHKYT